MGLIEVLISPKGVTSIQTKGFLGAECIKASQWLEQALGISVLEKKTAEYHATTASQQSVQQQ